MMRHKSFYLFLVLTMLPIVGFGIDIYTPALPKLAYYLTTSLSSIKMTVTIYLIGLCIGQVIFGALSDSYGRKPVLIFGILGFIIVSTTIPFFSDIKLIIFFRLLQGIFAGAPAVTCRSIIRDVFTKNEIPKATACMSIAWSMGPIIAPAIGAYIEFYLGWQVIFYFLALYGVVLLGIVCLSHETNARMVPLSFGKIVQDYKLILKQKFLIGLLFLMTFAYSTVILFSMLAPFLVQNNLKRSIIVYGNLAFLIGVAYLLGSILNRLLLQWFSPEKLIRSSLWGALIAILFFLLFSTKPSLLTLFLPMFFVIIMAGILFPNCLALSINLFPEIAGKASAVVGTGFMLMSSVLLLIVSYIAINSQSAFAILLCVLVLASIYINKKLVSINNQNEGTIECNTMP